MFTTRRLALAVFVLVALLIALQLVPYGRDHRNPPDGVVAAFDTPETEALAARACFDCHSNRTKWPWYASIAPASWRIQRHVEEGREALNFTAFLAGNEEMTEAAGEASETVTKGEMPPRDYLLMHPEARLSSAEQATLVRGLDATFAAYAEGDGREQHRAEARARRTGRENRSHEGEGERDDD